MSICLDEDTRLENTTLKHLESLLKCDFKALSQPPMAQFEDSKREIRVLKEKSIYRTIDKDFCKCYSLNLDIFEPRYRSILFGTNTILNLTNYRKLYLVEHRGRLDHETKFFRTGFKIKHETFEIRTFKNCTKYTMKNHDCESKRYAVIAFININLIKFFVFFCSNCRNCIDKCYVYEFLEKYKTLPFHSIVYAEYFKKDKNIKFNTSLVRDEDVWVICLKRYQTPDCDRSTITTHDKQIGNSFVIKGKFLFESFHV